MGKIFKKLLTLILLGAIFGNTLQAKATTNEEESIVDIIKEEENSEIYTNSKSFDGIYMKNTVYFNKPSNWGTPKIYAYIGEGSSANKITGEWPGISMRDEGNGVYSYTFDSSIESAKIIFTDGSNQDPGRMQPGFDYVYGNAYEYNNGQFIEVSPIEEIVINSFIADKKDAISGEKVKLSTNATGYGTLQYKYLVKDDKNNWYKLRDYSISNTYIWTTGSFGKKTLYVDVKDSVGNVKRECIQYDVKNIYPAPVINTFTVDKKDVKTEEKVTLSVNATGTGTLKYKFLIKDDENNWYKLKDYSTSNTFIWTAGKSGNKTLYVDVMDTVGNVTRSSMPYTVKSSLLGINSFTGDRDCADLGNEVTLNVDASGKGILEYKFVLEDENNNLYELKDYSTSNTYVWTADLSGDNTIYVYVKDNSGKVIRGEYKCNVSEYYATNTNACSEAIAKELYELVNEYRINNGLPIYEIDYNLQECSKDKSEHMVKNNYFAVRYHRLHWWEMYPDKYEKEKEYTSAVVLCSVINKKGPYSKAYCRRIAERMFTLLKGEELINEMLLSSTYKGMGFGAYKDNIDEFYGCIQLRN